MVNPSRPSRIPGMETTTNDSNKPTLAESLVDAIGEALGVDTGTIPESRFADALEAAQKILDSRENAA